MESGLFLTVKGLQFAVGGCGWCCVGLFVACTAGRCCVEGHKGLFGCSKSGLEGKRERSE